MSNLSDFIKSGAAGIVSVADSTAISIDVDENVGIGGTDVTGYRLSIEDSDTQVYQASNAPQVGQSIYNASVTGVATAGIKFHVGASGGALGGIDYLRTSATNGEMVFQTMASGSTSEKVRIDSSGKVGIGTNTPTHMLEVVGGIVEQGGALKEKLLTNSGFEIWSNSGGLYTTEGTVPANNDSYAHDTETMDDDCVDDETSDWTYNGTSLIHDADHYEVTNSASNTTVFSSADSSGGVLTEGKLYRLAFDIKDGTASSQGFSSRTYNAGGSTSRHIKAGTTTSGFVTHENIFVALGTELRVGSNFDSSFAGNNIEVQNIMLHEVTPGCVAADTLGPDGWSTTSGVSHGDIWRQHNDGGTLTKDGSFYSLKATAAGDSDTVVVFPSYNSVDVSDIWTQKFAGRTVTFGVWIKTSDSATGIAINDSGHIWQGYQNAVYHSGGGAWEWIETTATISASPTNFSVGFITNISDTAYFSQPILVFGSSIGEGNYTRPQGEEIVLENSNTANLIYNSSPSSGFTALNIEALSSGKIGKGINSCECGLFGRNSAANKWMMIKKDTITGPGAEGIFMPSQVANVNISNNGFVDVATDGTIQLRAEDANWSGVSVSIHAVTLR